MHLSDALMSTPVAVGGGVIAASLLAVAGDKMKKSDNPSLVPLMGVLGAFVFAAQMINFAIPGTGASGHVIGGVLLAAFLGPWAAFVTLASVLIIQCLVFADGGLLALGCNLLNMGATTTLIAYPLIFRPITRNSTNIWRISLAAILACTVGLELGSAMVTGEIVLSEITALNPWSFLKIMLLIHLPIGICEGIATGAVLAFVARQRPDLLQGSDHRPKKKNLKRILIGFGIATVVIACGLVWFASSNPDGLEWSVEREWTGDEAPPEETSIIMAGASRIVNTTSLMPDYENPASGIVGAVIVLLIVWCLSSLLIKKPSKKNSSDEKCQN